MSTSKDRSILESYLEHVLSPEEWAEVEEILEFENQFGIEVPDQDFSTIQVSEEEFVDELTNWDKRHPTVSLDADDLEATEQVITAILTRKSHD